MRIPRVKKAPRVRSVRRALRPVLGGKALARLHQYEFERTLEVTEATAAASDQPSLQPTYGSVETQPPFSREDAEASPYLAAFNHKTRLARTAPAMAIQAGWRPIGPFSIPHGQTYGSGPGSRPSVAGRISAVAIDPGAANHILIGAAGGGVWETTDGGNDWQPRTDNQPSLAIGAIAFDPSNPSIVYAGTGEGDAFWFLGAGLLRSSDGGTTWTLHAAAPFAGGAGTVGMGFYDLVVDPLNRNHLLAATRGSGSTGGLYESTDGGLTWMQRRAQRTWDLSMHPAVMGEPNSTQEVFAACADGLFRSTDGGTTWTAVMLPGAPAGWMRMEVCHAPSNGDVVYVFATDSTGNGRIWRRSAFGAAFMAVTPLPPGLNTAQAWYDWFAAVAPNNPDVLYLGAIEVHRGVRSATNTWTWSNLSAKTTGDSIHPDQHAIAFSPTDPNVVYVGNDGGIYRSPDGGTTWESLNKGLCITELEYLAPHPQFDAWLLGGTQDNGTQRYEGEEVWYHVQDGDGGDCGVNAASPYTCYHTFYGMGMERSTSGGGWGSWFYIGPNVPANKDYPNGALFYPPLEVNGSVVAQAGVSVFISTNTGATWSEVALPSGVTTALAIPTLTRVYAGTNQGHIYRIESSAGVWGAPVQLTRPRVGFVSDLLIDPTNANRIWATYSNLTGSHVFRSDDGGMTWDDVSAGLPSIPVNAVVVDPADTDAVYVAADVGVYRSSNAGATWGAFSNLLPNALAKDLVFHQESRLLRVATQSRGVWEIAVDQATMPDVEVYLRDSVVDTGRRLPSPSGVPDPFNLGALTHWWQCTDIKVDSPSYQKASLADVDFEVFEDDHGVFAGGLIHENTQRNRIVRVYVQVHNRGLNPATDVAVKVFFAAASVGLPDLPAGFWINFPNNMVPASSPWQSIAPHKVVPSVEAGRAQIVGFEWAVPPTAADHSCLLAVISAANDPLVTTELNIASLVLNHHKCGLKSLAVVNPPPSVGPRIRALKLNLWGSTKWKQYSLGVDRGASPMIRGLVLSKRLSRLAQEMNLERVPLDDEEQVALSNLVGELPSLREQLDMTVGYRSNRRGAWLGSFDLDPWAAEPVVVLIAPNPRSGHWSLVQWAEGESQVSGFTLQALARR